MRNIFPDWLNVLLSKNFKLEHFDEIRIRRNQPIQINYRGRNVELKNENEIYPTPIFANEDLINYILEHATNQSIYAFQDQIKNGFIITDNGIRIGLCGTAVSSNEKITMIKNITSLNIRIAHVIKNCSDDIIGYLTSNDSVKNTLIVSPPGAGKTTMLRDIICKLSNRATNIMVIDEKSEIAGSGVCFNLGKNVDIMQEANKKFCFYNAIRVMNPNIIICDEIISSEDVEGLKFAIQSGINVIATVHAKNIDDLKQKPNLKELLQENFIDRFVVLSKRNGAGTVEGVFDNKKFAIYLPYLRWKN